MVCEIYLDKVVKKKCKVENQADAQKRGKHYEDYWMKREY